MLYLEIWHVVILCAMFGFCAFHSRKLGFRSGISSTLQALHTASVIQVTRDGKIAPGTKTAPKPFVIQ